MKPKVGYWSVTISFVMAILSGCGPTLECSEGVDSKELLATLNDNTLSIDKLLLTTSKLLNSCSQGSTFNNLAGRSVSRIAQDGNASAQIKLYKELSSKVSDPSLRVKLISESTLFSGEAHPISTVSMVELDSLGQPLNINLASPALLAAIDTATINIENSPDYQSDYRVVHVGQDKLLVVRTTTSFNFTEASELHFYAYADGTPYKVPIDNLVNNYFIKQSNKTGFIDYFFGCENYAGSGCAIRDAKFAVDSKGSLKYIARTLVTSDQNCESTLETFRFHPSKRILALSSIESEKTECQEITPNSHGDPFKTYTKERILTRINNPELLPSVNLVELINFNKLDAADDALRKRVFAQDRAWSDAFLILQHTNSDTKSFSDKDGSERLKAIEDYLNLLMENIVKIQWLYRDTKASHIIATEAKNIKVEISSLRQKVSAYAIPPLPEKPDKPALLNDYAKVILSLARAIQPEDKGVMRLDEYPYMYLGVDIQRNNRLVILYSDRKVTERPGIVPIEVLMGTGPQELMFQGFYKDVWSYATLTKDQLQEAKLYYTALAEYQTRLQAAIVSRNKSIDETIGLAYNANEIQRLYQTLLRRVAANI